MRNQNTHRHSLRTKMIGINVTITLTSFIMCGALFVLSVSLLVGKYVNHDLDFFLTEMSDNLNTKISYMETVIYEIRDSEELMEYLENPGDRDAGTTERITTLFQKAANISDEANQGDASVPVVDKIYLFDNQGAYYSTYYYALVDSQIQYNNQAFLQVYQEKQAAYECREIGGKTYILYSLLNDSMDPVGTVIYELNIETIKEFMKGVKEYKHAFWVMHDREHIVAGDYEEDMISSMADLSKVNHYEPYIMNIKGGDFRAYEREMAVNMQILIAVPANQAVMMLYDSVKIYTIGIVAILLGGLIGFVIFTYKMTKPIREVTYKMSKVQEGEFDTKLPDYDSQEFHEISQVFNEMTEYINHLIKEVYEKQISIKEMELKFLQTQMNPHFMFNVLNTIALQSRFDGNEEVFRMISSFSQLIQAKIYRNNEDKVKIRQELEYVEYYLYLQSFRYGERLKYEIIVKNKEIEEMYIPKLCMQLIVENAVVHGIEPQMEAGRVRIVMETRGNSVYITISDSGVGFEEEGEILLPVTGKGEDRAHNHIGLNNAHHIIQLMYGEQYGIQILSSHKEGTRVTIHIPFDRGGKEAVNVV